MIPVKVTIALGYIILLSDISSLVKKSTVTTVAYRIKLGCHTLAFRALPSGTSLFQPHLSLFPSINPLLDLRWCFLHARYSSLHFWAWLSYCWIYSPLWISSFLTRILDTFSRPSSNLLSFLESSLTFPAHCGLLWLRITMYSKLYYILFSAQNSLFPPTPKEISCWIPLIRQCWGRGLGIILEPYLFSFCSVCSGTLKKSDFMAHSWKISCLTSCTEHSALQSSVYLFVSVFCLSQCIIIFWSSDIMFIEPRDVYTLWYLA